MNQEEQWLLPDGVEEVLPERARAIEQLRRRALDLYQSWGYELVYPPLIEFLESLLNGAGRDLERDTFKITDQLSGRLMGVRADMTPQVARIDAHSLRRNAPTRLCYCSTALRARPTQVGGTRLPYQLGVELFGHAGGDSDLEVILLMGETLALAGANEKVVLDLGHVGIFRALVDACDLDAAAQARLEDIYLRKARTELTRFLDGQALPEAAARALAALPFYLLLANAAGPLGWAGALAQFLVIINLILGGFNMIPVPPLDGSKIMAWSSAAWGGIVAGILALAMVYRTIPPF